jgi:hypothetical protein
MRSKYNYIDNKAASMSPRQAAMSNKDYYKDLVRIAKGGIKR